MSETPSIALTTGSERRLASGHWLLSAAASAPQAQSEWDERGAAWLRPGVLFSALSMPADTLHAAVGLDCPEACADPLTEVLEDGPLFFRPDEFQGRGSYTALVPARVARLRVPLPGVITLPQGALLLVPAPDRTEPAGDGPWWVTPLNGPGLLCSPERVTALAGLGRDALAAKGARQDA